METSELVGWIFLGFVLVFTSPVMDLVSQWLRFRKDLPLSSDFVLNLRMAPDFLFCIWMLAVPVMPIVLVYRWQKRRAIWPALALTLFSFACIPMHKAAGDVMMRGVLSTTKRGAPLIAAIERYKEDKGTYPPDLKALIPTYIRSIPDTGDWNAGEFDYIQSSANAPAKTYEVMVQYSIGFQWDSLHYWPGGDYSVPMGGRVEPVGGWAYVHE